LDPAAHGFTQGGLHFLRGGTVVENVNLLQLILRGKGPTVAAETVALNAGAVLHAAGLADTVISGATIAMECLRDGTPYAKLKAAQRFVRAQKPRLEAAE
jgi:anthranilate phosphoribosyltransferase